MTVVPSSTRPRRFTAPASKSRAETSEVLPQPPWPTSATLRMLGASYTFMTLGPPGANKGGSYTAPRRPARGTIGAWRSPAVGSSWPRTPVRCAWRWCAAGSRGGASRGSRACRSPRARSCPRPPGRTCSGRTRCATPCDGPSTRPAGRPRRARSSCRTASAVSRCWRCPPTPTRASSSASVSRRRCRSRPPRRSSTCSRPAAAASSGRRVRRGAVAEYEQAAASLGLALERVHLAPLLALGALMRAGSRGGRGRGAGRRGGVLRGAARRGDRGPAQPAARHAPPVRPAGSSRRPNGSRGWRRTATGGAPSSCPGRTRRGCGPRPAWPAPQPPPLAGIRQWPEAAEAAWLRGLVS